MIPEPTLLAAGMGVLVLAYFVKGVSCFGPALVSVPLLGMLWPEPSLYIQMLAVINIFANGLLLRRFWGSIAWRPLTWMFIGTLLGVPFGAHLLQALPPAQLRMIIGVAVVSAVPVIFWIQRMGRSTHPAPWAGILAGALSGVIGGAIAIDGPPYVAYLTLTLAGKEERYATLLAVFFLSALTRVSTYAMEGMLGRVHLEVALWSAPAVTVGLILGLLAYRRLTDRGFDHVVSAVLLLTGLALLLRPLLSA